MYCNVIITIDTVANGGGIIYYGNKCLSLRAKKMCSSCRQKKSEDEQLHQQLHQAFGELFNRIENRISTLEGRLNLSFDAAVPYNVTANGRYLVDTYQTVPACIL